MNIKENENRSKSINRGQGTLQEINEQRCKSMNIKENLSKSIKFSNITERQCQSRKTLEINEKQCNSMNIGEKQ